jgi:hypothetical protein
MVVGDFEPLTEGGILMVECHNRGRENFDMAGMKRL